MASKIDLDEYRQRVFEALRADGLPIDLWQRELEAEIAANPTAKARPFTILTPPKYGKITKVRPGFTETIEHPRHGRPVPRCQASLKGSGGKTQCSKFALRGKHLCRTHGGAAGSGIQSPEGRTKQIAAVTLHGNETAAKRQGRSRASQELRSLEKQAREAGMITGLGSRGPYWKPRRKGEPMGHIKRKKS